MPHVSSFSGLLVAACRTPAPTDGLWTASMPVPPTLARCARQSDCDGIVDEHPMRPTEQTLRIERTDEAALVSRGAGRGTPPP